VRLVVLVLVPLVLAGCTEDVLEEQTVRVAGKPDSTSPTNVYLKAHLTTPEGGVRTVAFDRADWYVAGLEKELGRTDFLVVEGRAKLNNEVVTEQVVAPEDLAARYRYDDMAATEEQKASMDREWDDRLAALARETAEGDLGWLGRANPVLLA